VKINLITTALFLIFAFQLVAQNVSIHAESVGEWKSTQSLSPEYHYNSVAVFLLNEDKLFRLFNPANLSKNERKKTGIKTFDTIESLYFHLEMPNPKKEGDILSFPLYAFDIKPSTNFKSSRSQGKILDRITDEELNGKALEAVARIEAIKKNQLLEVAYKISSNINKLLGDKVFKKPDIWQIMKKAQQYFEDRYRGKMVAEFNIPILPASEEYEYVIQSASLYQIKWDFQPRVDSYKDNIWYDLRNKAVISEEDLRDKPTRLSKLNAQPYLMVVRYKSAYALPTEQQLNVAISDTYLQKRLYNLQEFKTESIQYNTEELFLEHLRLAIELQENITAFQRSNEKGQVDAMLLAKITQQYYTILETHKRGLLELDQEAQVYYDAYYETTYFKFFKLIEQLLFDARQIKELSETPIAVLQLADMEVDSLSERALYNYLEKLQPYRSLTRSLKQPTGELFYNVQKQTTKIEQNLFAKIMENIPYERADKIPYLEASQQQYPFCKYCEEEAQLQIKELQTRITDAIRIELMALQNKQLKYGRCFADLQRVCEEQMTIQYPTPETLSNADLLLYDAFKSKKDALDQLTKEFQQIADLDIMNLSAEDMQENLKMYTGLVADFQRHICQLVHGGLLTKTAVSCLGEICREEIP